jgi:hypothetical protein
MEFALAIVETLCRKRCSRKSRQRMTKTPKSASAAKAIGGWAGDTIFLKGGK